MMKTRRLLLLTLLLLSGLLDGCSRQFFRQAPLPGDRLVNQYSSDTMVLVNRPYSEFIKGDDLSRLGLTRAINQSRLYLERVPADEVFHFGSLTYSAREMAASLRLFQDLLLRENEYNRFIAELEQHFYVFKSVANDSEGVLLTGYYEPLFEGSLEPSEDYPVPVYKVPDDLRVLDLGNFRDSLKDRTIVYRLVDDQVLPYYSRKEIMEDKALSGRQLEIAWMKDPVDLFFLQIQGSGVLRLPTGQRVKLGYAGANGQPYSSIGKLLVDENIMPLEAVSMGSIRQYLKDHPHQVKRILYHNRSYIFFQFAQGDDFPRGCLNVPITPHRSVATDVNIFPKGSIGYLVAEIPTFDKDLKLKGTAPLNRFVVNQDTGGAIKGPGRADLFWGSGPLAEKSAGTMRSLGRLYFLVAKKEVLAEYAGLY